MELKPQASAEKPTGESLQIRNILCPVDFSESSFKGFAYAICLARHFRSCLFLLNTANLSPRAYVGAAEPVAVGEMLESDVNQAGAKMRRLAAEAGLELPEVFIELNEGDIPDQILQSIEEHQIDLVVMGTHGRKGFERLMLGSVTDRIMHQARCPLLVVQNPLRDFVSRGEAEPVHVKTILLPVDFSPNSDWAFRYGLKWASEWSSKVIVFHALQETSFFPEHNLEKESAQAWEKMERLVLAAAHEKCTIAYEVRHGAAKDEILQAAEARNADLIVMGSRGVGRSDPTWGSTISGVVRDGRFPVLAVGHASD